MNAVVTSDLAQAPDVSEIEASKKLRALKKALVLVSALVFCIGLFLRIQGLLMFGETINEYDPWFNFRCSEYIREHGVIAFLNWKDDKTWAPQGRNIGHTTYPGLMIISNGIHFLLDLISPFSLSHYQVCAIVPIICFLASSFILWHIGKHIRSPLSPWGIEKQAVSLALFSISGGHLEKTISGAFDYEGLSVLSILCILFTYSWCSRGRGRCDRGRCDIDRNRSRYSSNVDVDANVNGNGKTNDKTNDKTNTNTNDSTNTNDKTNTNANTNEKNINTNDNTNKNIINNNNSHTNTNPLTNPLTITITLYGCLIGVLQSAFLTVWGGSPITAGLIASFEVLRLGSPMFLASIALVLLLARSFLPFTSLFGLDVISLFGASIICTLLQWILASSRPLTRALLVFTSVFLGTVAVLWKAKAKALSILQQSKAYNLFLGQSTHPVVQSVAEHQSPGLSTFTLLFGPVGYLYIPFLLVYLYFPLRSIYWDWVGYKCKCGCKWGWGNNTNCSSGNSTNNTNCPNTANSTNFSSGNNIDYINNTNDTNCSNTNLANPDHSPTQLTNPIQPPTQLTNPSNTGNSYHLVVLGAGLVFFGLLLWMERFAPFFSPFLILTVSDVLVECIMYAKGHIAVRYLFRLVACSVLLIHVGVSLVFASGLLIDGVVIIPTATSGVLVDDFREAAAYMKYNSEPDCSIISWWDYGYQITGMTGRRTVIDNNTNDYNRISEVASLLMSPEEKVGSTQIVSELIQSYDSPIYFYVVCGHMSQYPHSDMHKASWILRISEETQNKPSTREYYYSFRGIKQRFMGALDTADHRTGKLNGESISISSALKNSLLYKLSYYQYDPSIELASTELFYQTRHHLIRIYRLKQ